MGRATSIIPCTVSYCKASSLWLSEVLTFSDSNNNNQESLKCGKENKINARLDILAVVLLNIQDFLEYDSVIVQYHTISRSQGRAS
jgi:hypothetical protein